MKITINLILSGILIFILKGSLFAQDPVFSQSFSSPLTLNPSLTGLIEGSYRVSAIYRDQWRSILDKPFTTYSAIGDVRFQRNAVSSNNPDYFGVGLQFYSDRVAIFDLNTTRLSLFGAYHKSLDKTKNQYLSVGLQIGVVQKNVNYESLNFQDEFNGVNGFDLPTAENLPPNNFGFGDYALGLHYTIQTSNRIQLFSGFAYSHLVSPNISFYKSDQSISPDISENKLYRKLTAHFSLKYQLSEVTQLTPRILYVQQGPHKIAQIGSTLKYALLSSEGRAYQLGGWVRMVDGEASPSLESAVLMAGIELNGLLIGLSYDITLSDVLSELKGQGAFELSISFIGEYDNEVNFCPEF